MSFRALTPAVVALALAAPVVLTARAQEPAQAAPAASSATTRAVAGADLGPTIAGALRRDATNRYLRSSLSATVADAGTGRALWSTRAATTRMPASTQKVLTAFTVLRTAGADHQLVTRAYQSTANPGNVYLRGAGDPSLTPARLASLATRTAATLRAQGRASVNLYLDDTVFPRPTNATGWKASYLSGREVQPVRGLTLAGHRGGDGTIAAGNAFRARLKTAGVNVVAYGRGTTPAARTELAASWSATVGGLVGTMLSRSDNDYAEALFRIAALQAGRYPTWANAGAVEKSVVANAGIPTTGLVVHDGSGLSRADRMPTPTLVATIAKLYASPADRAVVFSWGAMPVAGRTGTLASRYRAGAPKCAAGRVIAKTGTLGDVVALAGIAKGVDGRDRAFAFIENGVAASASSRAAIDTLAASATGCRR